MRKKVDSRVRTLVENGVRTKTRAFFVIVGDRGRDQVVNLHYMTSKISGRKPSVLWCYQKELGFSSHRKKRMKQVKKLQAQGQYDANVDDPFDLFISSTNIRYCYYKETEQVLGKTYGMCVLQDFASLTPNILCRVMETVEGGGLIVLLLNNISSLRQLYKLSMDAHTNLRTETHVDVEPRFNERFILSLRECSSCLVVDDELNILPISPAATGLKPVEVHEDLGPGEAPKSANEVELDELKATTADTQPLGPILSVAKTLDQAKSVMSFIDAVSEKTLNRTVALTAGRGRGKSAALGLAVSAAVAYGYSNIFLTAPSPENLTTVFEFIVKGFDALGMVEHQQYELVQAQGPEKNKALVRLNIFKDHRQTVQYINPGDWQHLAQAEMLVIDEAAAIPLPTVKALLGPYLVLMSSTVNGYEGTGRALSLKLIEDLRQGKSVGRSNSAERTLKELTLEEPIRYALGDPVEAWLGRLLCLDAAQVPPMQAQVLAPPDQCTLFFVNRNALFSHHEASERFLFKMMSLFVSSHYKNSPNDLLLMADAPGHHILVLLAPVDAEAQQTELPEVLVAIQICMEGAIAKETVRAAMSKGVLPSGNLIPWTLSQHFLHDSFAQLSGARIVRIATHPALQRKGYATEAVKQLVTWFEQKSRGAASFGLEEDQGEACQEEEEEAGGLLKENLKPRKVPPLLQPVAETAPPYAIDYVGTSFGLTSQLYDFWRKGGFLPVYMRQRAHDATGEHSCILIRVLTPLEGEAEARPLVEHFVADFRSRFLRLLQGPFRSQPVRLALSVVDPPVSSAAEVPGSSREGVVENQMPLTAASLLQFLSRDDVHRLEKYSQKMLEYNLVLDIVPSLATIYLSRRMPEVQLSHLQCAILVAVGCQHRTFDELALELGAPTTQLLALFNKAMHKIANHCTKLLEEQVEEEELAELNEAAGTDKAPKGKLKPLEPGENFAGAKSIKEPLSEDQQAAGKKVSRKLEAARNDLLASLSSEYAVAPDAAAIHEALGGGVPKGSVSVRRKAQSGEDPPGDGKKKRRL